MKIWPMAANLFHAEKQTDMTKLGTVFCNFANEPKNQQNVIIMEIPNSVT
jgi:hypothetical protein